MEKADEMLKKLEDNVRDTKEDRAQKERKNNKLETRIKNMARQLPCSRNDCDYSCGRDHHCTTTFHNT